MIPKNDLIDVVVSDLIFLRKDWDEEVDDHSLRRSSPILRRLLVDNELQRAWKAAGFEKEPMIETSTLRPLLDEESLVNIEFASAGGAKYRGMELRGMTHLNYSRSPEDIKKDSLRGVPMETLGLIAFNKAPCVIVKGRIISRHVLIKYVSNKLGGAHHDIKRKATGEELLFSRLAKTQGIALAGKPAVYFELLSIGQTLSKSSDIGRLISSVRT